MALHFEIGEYQSRIDKAPRHFKRRSLLFSDERDEF